MPCKVPCVKREKENLRHFYAMSGLHTKTRQLHAVFCQFHSREERLAAGLGEISSK